jgi:mannose-6-phosphate isomerase-like protein (cupin superfamily)
VKKINHLICGFLMLGCAAVSMAQTASGVAQIRRVVTSVNSAGKAVVLFDDKVDMSSLRSPNPAGDVWVTQQYPLNFSDKDDWAKTKVGVSPGKNGTLFRIVDFVPTTEKIERLPVDTMMKIVGDNVPKRGMPPRHSMMHRTRTVDYALVLSGEIDMLLDDTEVHLKEGDVVVQQASNHAWVNRGTKNCRVAFILMDSQEP